MATQYYLPRHAHDAIARFAFESILRDEYDVSLAEVRAIVRVACGKTAVPRVLVGWMIDLGWREYESPWGLRFRWAHTPAGWEHPSGLALAPVPLERV